jgi:hyperosmotically inducible protein
MRNVLQYFMVAMVVAVLATTGCQKMTGETASENVSDTGITTAVKSKLAGDRMGTLGQISVKTVRDTVYLTGVVPSTAEKMRAEELAKEVKGVNKVQNDLQVSNINR